MINVGSRRQKDKSPHSNTCITVWSRLHGKFSFGPHHFAQVRIEKSPVTSSPGICPGLSVRMNLTRFLTQSLNNNSTFQLMWNNSPKMFSCKKPFECIFKVFTITEVFPIQRYLKSKNFNSTSTSVSINFPRWVGIERMVTPCPPESTFLQHRRGSSQNWTILWTLALPF